MANELKRLPEFIEAVHKEFDEIHHEHEGMEKLLLGERIYSVQADQIIEDEYIEKWLSS